MAVLKQKIRSATLMEAIVATALIVVIFVIASLVLNNLLKSYYLGKTHDASYRLNQLRYELSHHKISLPYNEKFSTWNIEIKPGNNLSYDYVIFSAQNEETGKTLLRKYIVYGQY